MVDSNNLITFDRKLHAFNIKGTLGKIRVVTQFPRKICSCPATGTYCHIIAAKMSLRVSFANEPTWQNLTQLWRNLRSLREKNHGKRGLNPQMLILSTVARYQHGLQYLLALIHVCHLHVLVHFQYAPWCAYLHVHRVQNSVPLWLQMTVMMGRGVIHS